MALISYSDVIFMMDAIALNSAINDMVIDSSQVATGETNVDAAKEFIRLFDEISDMLEEFKTLMKSDQKALVKAGVTEKNQDKLVAQLWK